MPADRNPTLGLLILLEKKQDSKNNENTRCWVESSQTTFYTHVLKVYIFFQGEKKPFIKITKFSGTTP
jgi:hypothetical protein